MTFARLRLAVALAHQVLYPSYQHAPRLLGLDPMTDQQIAGASIALVSKIALLTAFVIVLVRLLGNEPDDAEGGDDGGSKRRPRVDSPQPLPSGAPDWLNELRDGRTVTEPEPDAPARVRELVGAGPGRG